MVEISFLRESDRAEWEVLARSFHVYFSTEINDDVYERTWGRLLEGDEIRGVGARLDGKLVGIAHYLFHTSIWNADNWRCYLADMFVDKEVRRQGVATAILEWVARDAEEHGAPRFYWNTTQDNTMARALYDKVANFKGHIVYNYRRDANAGSR